MNICVAGKYSIAINAIKYLIDTIKISKDSLFICINRDDKGEDKWQPSLLKYANNNGLNNINISSLQDIENLIFISLEYDRIINTNHFRSDQLFNIHFSLLPNYKGMYTSTHPILNGENTTGVTLHLIDNGIDTGPIINQLEFDIGINYSAKDLYKKYLEYGLRLFKESILSLIDKSYKHKGQTNIGSYYYSKYSIDFNNIKIDYNNTSFSIHNQIRAYIFEDYQLPTINGSKIIKSILTDRLTKNCSINEEREKFIISGIDGFIIEAYKKK